MPLKTVVGSQNVARTARHAQLFAHVAQVVNRPNAQRNHGRAAAPAMGKRSDIIGAHVPGTNTMQIFYGGLACRLIGSCDGRFFGDPTS
jgi:hypothetical protein